MLCNLWSGVQKLSTGRDAEVESINPNEGKWLFLGALALTRLDGALFGNRESLSRAEAGVWWEQRGRAPRCASAPGWPYGAGKRSAGSGVLTVARITAERSRAPPGLQRVGGVWEEAGLGSGHELSRRQPDD